MWNTFGSHFATLATAITPNNAEKVVLAVGGAIGAGFSWAVGGVTDAMQWLMILAAIDYVTGSMASRKEGKLCSERGALGIFKKAFMFGVIAVCHGVDVSTGQNYLRDIAVFAYSLNEVLSMIENVERLGYGHWIPPFLKAGLKVLKDKEDELLKKGGVKNDKSSD